VSEGKRKRKANPKTMCKSGLESTEKAQQLCVCKRTNETLRNIRRRQLRQHYGNCWTHCCLQIKNTV